MNEERALRDALVGEKHQMVYRTNAQFKNAIDLLARLLPPMVDGLAAQAEASAVVMAEDVRRLEAEARVARLYRTDEINPGWEHRNS